MAPVRYPGSNWLTGSQHQVNATLATRTVPRKRYRARPRFFIRSWRPARAMWNWLVSSNPGNENFVHASAAFMSTWLELGRRLTAHVLQQIMNEFARRNVPRLTDLGRRMSSCDC